MNPKLFNPDYLKSLCQRYGLRPSKKYGQNFLINPEPIEKMIEAAGVSKSDTVVEIGPGFGVLTFALAAKAGKVVAFEIEKKLQKYWEKDKPENVEIVWGNVLKILDIKILDIKILDIDKYKVVANLPYQITSAVIRKFLETDNPPSVMVLMVQKEVAERICAKPGGMSLLSVAVQYYADAEIIAPVPRSSFWPEPKVDSAILRLRLEVKNRKLENPPSQGGEGGVGDTRGRRHKGLTPPNPPQGGITTADIFFKIVKAGFAQRRKLLIKNLSPFGRSPEGREPLAGKNRALLKEIFRAIGLDEKVRAQELSVSDWQELEKRLALKINK